MLNSLKKLFKRTPPIVIVVAMSRVDRAIGYQNDLLWHIPADLRRFKKLTTGHPIIMGRKTFESILSILGKPLPGRTNIVITRDTSYTHEGAIVTHSLADALSIAKSEKPKEIHIGGGSEIYRLALPYVERLYVTWINSKVTADTFFPPFEDEFSITHEEIPQEFKDITFQWTDYSRKRS